jgi:DNA replication initiation complex subunit (GINS family)
MQVTEQIEKRIQNLPEAFQSEVLDFIEYLLTKAEQQKARQDDLDWAAFALETALRGMENEEPLYSEDDLKVVFS